MLLEFFSDFDISFGPFFIGELLIRSPDAPILVKMDINYPGSSFWE